MKFLKRKQRDEELDAEIRSHLDEAIRDRLERGESPDEARANALREFGSVGLVKEVTRATWGWGTLERLGQDCGLGCECCAGIRALRLSQCVRWRLASVRIRRSSASSRKTTCLTSILP